MSNRFKQIAIVNGRETNHLECICYHSRGFCTHLKKDPLMPGT